MNLPIKCKPYPKQQLLMQCPADEILWGGAKGGAKTRGIVLAISYFSLKHPGISIGVFRKSYPELRDGIIASSLELYPDPFYSFSISQNNLFWKNGSKVSYRQLDNDTDLAKYLGLEFEIVIVDEVGQLTEYQITNLKTCARSTKSFNGKQFRPKFIGLTNPIGPGKGYLKRRYITDKTPMKLYKTEETKDYPKTFMLRGEKITLEPKYQVFIPAKLTDNPELLKTGYLQTLRDLPYELQRAFIYGDWDNNLGTFFPMFDKKVHVIDDYKPDGLDELYIGVDWGTKKPFAVLWVALRPSGEMVVYREYYGCRPGQVDTGIEITIEQMGRNIVARCPEEEQYRYMVLDTQCWAKDSQGDSAYEHLQKAVRERKITIIQAKKDRVNGWLNLKRWLMPDSNGKPLMTMVRKCYNLIRTIPDLVYDDHKDLDLNTKMEDHCVSGETLILTEKGETRIDEISVGEMVQTRMGYRPVIKVWKNGKKKVYRLVTSNGTELIVTGNHPVFTGRGWRSVDCLRYSDTISIWQKRKSSLMGSNTGGMTTGITDVLVLTIRKGFIIFTEMFTLPLMETFRRVMLFITKTMIQIITILVILNSYLINIILSCIKEIVRFPSTLLLKIKHVFGTPQKKDATSTQNKQVRCGLRSRIKSIYADYAVKGMSQKRFRKSSIVQIGVELRLGGSLGLITRLESALNATKLMRLISIPRLNTVKYTDIRVETIKSIKLLDDKQFVYNLSVEDNPEYVANGILVHNCLDTLRYITSSRPRIKSNESERGFGARQWGAYMEKQFPELLD